MRLSNIGYKVINELNEKYNISIFEITNMEEYEEFKNAFFVVAETTNIIDPKNLKIMTIINEGLNS
jgi:uncharacterized protein YlxP (DUF503 family)